MSLGPLFVFLGEVSVQVLCPFWGCLSSWSGVVWVLYIFWRSGPRLRYRWQICFPILLVLFFILMLFSLAVRKLFILIKSHLFILSFMSLALGDMSLKILLFGISEIFLPMFSRTFMVPWLIFKSSICLDFIFVYGVNWWSSFIFFAFTITVLLTPFCWRDYFCCILFCCPLCQILIDRRDLGLFLGSVFCSIGPCVCSYANTRLFWLQCPCNTVWYHVLWYLLLCSSFSKLIELFRVIYGSIWISEMFVLYLWNMSWVL